jgi:hypothetical protein
MSRTLLTGAQIKVAAPRSLRFAEVRQYLVDKRYEDTDVDWNEANELETTNAEPCSWVAMIEAAALQGAL